MKILVLGLDGTVAGRLFTDERLSNFRRLADGGCYGRLEGVVPSCAVPGWACLATSQDPGSLGLYGPRNRADRSYDAWTTAPAESIRATTLWDRIASGGGKSVLVGVPPGWPPRRVSGVSIGFTAGTAGEPCVCPAELEADIRKLVGDWPIDVEAAQTEDESRLKDALEAMSRKQFAVVRHLMQTTDWDYFHFVEVGLDRLQRAFWNRLEAQEPGHASAGIVADYYRYLDDQLGSLLELLTDDTIVLVASVHGDRRIDDGFSLDEWLVREGLLVMDEHPGPDGQLKIDWSKTAVWSDGGSSAGLFLNVRGREPQGAIDPADYEKMRDGLKSRLEAAIDCHGKPLGIRAYKPAEIYRAVHGIAPDLIVQPSDTGPDGGRVSQAGAFILAAAGNPLDGEVDGATVLDVAPTLLELAGHEIPPEMQGRSLVSGKTVHRSETTDLTADDERIIMDRLSGLGYI